MKFCPTDLSRVYVASGEGTLTAQSFEGRAPTVLSRTQDCGHDHHNVWWETPKEDWCSALWKRESSFISLYCVCRNPAATFFLIALKRFHISFPILWNVICQGYNTKKINGRFQKAWLYAWVDISRGKWENIDSREHCAYIMLSLVEVSRSIIHPIFN